MSVYNSSILYSPKSIISKKISEMQPNKKDCSSSKSTLYISIEELNSQKKRQSSLASRNLKSGKDTEKSELRKKSTSFNQKKIINIVKMKLELKQYKIIEYIRNTKEQDCTINILNPSEMSTNTTTDVSISSPKILEKKESKILNEIKGIPKKSFVNEKMTNNKFLSSKQAANCLNQIRNIKISQKNGKIRSDAINSQTKNITQKNDSKKTICNDYNCVYDLSILRKEPPKITKALNSNINLINKDEFISSNNHYGKIMKDTVPNAFYNHLIMGDIFDYKEIIKTCSTKRNKGKLLTLIYYNTLYGK